jgi:membrane-associated phospholipid phosphatase
MMTRLLLAQLILFGGLLSLPALADDLTVLDHAEKTFTGAFDSTGLWILGGGAVATIIAHQFDGQMHDAWMNHQKMSPGISNIGQIWGQGIPAYALIATQVIVDKNNGIPAAEGMLAGGIVAQISKHAIGRARPDSNTKTSFPSGHTQVAFSIAMSTTESYGWAAGAPFWAMGIFTGLTRIADDAHFLSDVVSGAVLGALFGRAGYAHHRQVQPVVLFREEGRPDGAEVAFRVEW